MLNLREREIMSVIYSLCEGTGRCLASPKEILRMLPKKRKLTEERLEKILRELELDDYFELLSSDRKGEKMYVVTLHSAGVSFKRETEKQKRDIAYKLFWAVVSAVVAFLVGVFLRSVF